MLDGEGKRKQQTNAMADKAEAQTFLESLLNRKLRVHTTDERMFWGDFKCTDPV